MRLVVAGVDQSTNPVAITAANALTPYVAVLSSRALSFSPSKYVPSMADDAWFLLFLLSFVCLLFGGSSVITDYWQFHDATPAFRQAF